MLTRSTETLKLANVPPIEVVETINGFGIIDGYHRVEAARRLGRSDIRAHVQFYPSENAVIDAAFTANVAHGKPASAIERKKYVLWLYATTKLPQTAIAEKAGIQQSWVSRIIAQARNDTPEKTVNILKVFSRICKRFLSAYTDFMKITHDITAKDAAIFLYDEMKKQGISDTTINDMIVVFKIVEKLQNSKRR